MSWWRSKKEQILRNQTALKWDGREGAEPRSQLWARWHPLSPEGHDLLIWWLHWGTGDKARPTRGGMSRARTPQEAAATRAAPHITVTWKDLGKRQWIGSNLVLSGWKIKISLYTLKLQASSHEVSQPQLIPTVLGKKKKKLQVRNYFKVVLPWAGSNPKSRTESNTNSLQQNAPSTQASRNSHTWNREKNEP